MDVEIDRREKKDSERRNGKPTPPLFGELLVEAGWEPEGHEAPRHEGWLRAWGLAPDRRALQRRR